MKPIIFKDKNNNHYLYSFTRRKLLNVSVQVYNVLDSYLNKSTSFNMITSQLHNFISDPKIVEKTIKQFEFFKDYGFLDNDEDKKDLLSLNPNRLSKEITQIEVITFEVTQKCNLQCNYCIYGSMYENQENNHFKDLDFEKAKILIDFLFKKYNSDLFLSVNKRISFGFYGGEPLLNFELISEIVKYINKKNINEITVEYTLTTNCLLLDKYMDFLAENDFILLLSLDGDFQSSMYRTSNKKVFNHLINNIKCLKEKHPDYFNRRVAFNAVLHDKNSIDNTIKYIKTNFKITPFFSEISPVSLLDQKYLEFSKMRKVIATEIVQNKNKINEDDYIKINPEIQFLNKFFNSITTVKIDNLTSLLNNAKVTHYLPTSTCSPFSYKLFVDADGNLHPCEKIGYKYPLGFIDVDNDCVHFNFDEIAQEYNSYYSNMFKICEKCYNFYTCSTCLLEKKNKCYPVSKEEYTTRLNYFVNKLLDEKSNFSKNTNNAQS